MEYDELRAEVADVGSRVGELIAEAPCAQQQVRSLEWDVGQLASHLVTVARRNIDVGGGANIEWDFEPTHEGMASFNARQIEQVGERDLATLSSLLTQENQRALEAYGLDGERPVRWPRYQSTAGQSLAAWLGELLVHGLDLARTLRRPWPITDAQASAAFGGLLPALPAFVDRSTAEAAAGSYHLHLRDGHDYAIDVRPDGTITTYPSRPPRPDLHISAAPVANLLVGYQRISRWSALLRGSVVTWGKKPWLAVNLTRLFEQP